MKPHNLMLARAEAGKPPLVKILDFGLARFEWEGNEPGRLTQAGKVLGTVDYMSPEQATDARHVDIRSDIYGLGCTLFFLLTGQPPFPGDDMVERLSARLLGDPPSVRAVRPDVPAALDEVVAKMMARDPAGRYQAPAAVGEALAPFAKIPRMTTPVPAALEIKAPSTAPSDRGSKDGVPRQATPVPAIRREHRSPSSSGSNRGSKDGVPRVPGRKSKVVMHTPPPPTKAPAATAAQAERTETDVVRNPLIRPRPKAHAPDRKRLMVLVGGITVALVLGVGGMIASLSWHAPVAAKNPPPDPPHVVVPPPPPPAEKELTNSIGMKLVLIPAGTFTMGSPAAEKGREDNETQHKVEIGHAFYIGVYLVTQQEYLEMMDKNPSFFSAVGNGKKDVAGLNTSMFPAEMVSWDDAVAFCERLTRLEGEKQRGRTYRLPTEAEWEYACRAGTTTAFSYGDKLSSKEANFDGNYPYGAVEKGPYLRRTTLVGSYPKNAFGLYDMHGDVQQWCSDWYGEDYYKNSLEKDPQGPDKGYSHVLRGGSYFVKGVQCPGPAATKG